MAPYSIWALVKSREPCREYGGIWDTECYLSWLFLWFSISHNCPMTMLAQWPLLDCYPFAGWSCDLRSSDPVWSHRKYQTMVSRSLLTHTSMYIRKLSIAKTSHCKKKHRNTQDTLYIGTGCHQSVLCMKAAYVFQKDHTLHWDELISPCYPGKDSQRQKGLVSLVSEPIGQLSSKVWPH